jgi:hypothetical protein
MNDMHVRGSRSLVREAKKAKGVDLRTGRTAQGVRRGRSGADREKEQTPGADAEESREVGRPGRQVINQTGTGLGTRREKVKDLAGKQMRREQPLMRL